MILGRLILSLILGGIIGIEREYHNKQAGFKTHTLVCVGSCLIMIISIYGFGDWVNHPNARFDPARLAAQVVSGIGFLAGGAILVRPDLIVSGLTTAATLWMASAIGLGVGTGFYFASIVGTLIVLFATLVMPSIEQRIIRLSKRYKKLTIEVEDQPGQLGRISSVLGQEGCNIRDVQLHEKRDRDGRTYILLGLTLSVPHNKDLMFIVDHLHTIEGIRDIHWELGENDR
jgi:putative Mg2+ transporter-C (MgtC) family protein